MILTAGFVAFAYWRADVLWDRLLPVYPTEYIITQASVQVTGAFPLALPTPGFLHAHSLYAQQDVTHVLLTVDCIVIILIADVQIGVVL